MEKKPIDIQKFEIWYRRPTGHPDLFLFDPQLRIPNGMPDDRYVRVCTVGGECDSRPVELSDVYELMQGERWSPNGERTEYIWLLGLAHTSMSIGDLIHDVSQDRWYQVGLGEFMEVAH